MQQNLQLNKVCHSAAEEAVNAEGTTDIGVSVDGTWQKRGIASLNGVVAAVSTTNFKIVDVETSRNCRGCANKETLSKENKELYYAWKENHQAYCQANYSGSAPGMETEGAVRIFLNVD